MSDIDLKKNPMCSPRDTNIIHELAQLERDFKIATTDEERTEIDKEYNKLLKELFNEGGNKNG